MSTRTSSLSAASLTTKGRPKREIGVDQMRDVIADAQVLPNEAARKVYIIDPRGDDERRRAERRTETFGGRGGRCSLLCTTNAMQLLPTVLSRCAGGHLPRAGEGDGQRAAFARGGLSQGCRRGKPRKSCCAGALQTRVDGRAAVDFIDCACALSCGYALLPAEARAAWSARS